MKTISQTRALQRIEKMFRGHFSPMAILTILQIATALYTFKSEQGKGFSADMSFEDFTIEMSAVPTKDLIALVAELNEVDPTATLIKRELFMEVMKRLADDEVTRQEEIELEARVQVAEELRKQEQVENQILTFDAQSLLVVSARAAVVAAYAHVMLELQKFTVDITALQACGVIVRTKKHYLDTQEAILEKMSEAYAKSYFPEGMKL